MKREQLPVRQDPYVLYEQLKRDWIARNPNATPEDYQAAMVRLAREAGV